MKIRETTASVADGDGTVESAKQRFSVIGKRGEITFALTVTHPEGQQLSTIKAAMKRLGHDIEDGNQITLFPEESAEAVTA